MMTRLNLIKVLIVLLMLSSSSSCSNSLFRTHPNQKGVDPTFEPYVKEYSNIINLKNKKNKGIYNQRINKLSVNFTVFNDNTIGRCYWLMNGEFEVEIDKMWWDRASFVSKQFLMYHELEHCVRFRMHTHVKEFKYSITDYWESFMYWLGIYPKRGYFLDGCADSIMYPHDLGDWCHMMHYNQYVEEIASYEDTNL